ncbi:hypothetical protein Asulf_01579 [Archaeoglobus sulfaticallidus PM70-1]|uniref:SCP domain-containing protein n=1 Tax=Archaeoglobus sulfaticallidus PM70-1 TaxID=387631 RepID=N0BLX5_9EURY|nr:CAP domain-containing protein [Archaeoglobus sulfaticallidus]AGK61556.1 hypothetical protein Asulf_01579 [Archaeoglobus sulfaticallidus PM70-1]
MNKYWIIIIFTFTILYLGCAEKQQESVETPTSMPTLETIETLTPLPTPKKFSFYFYINETGESLNGEVYLNGKFLGKTTNGGLSLPVDILYPGIVVLKGTYSGEPFEFRFELNESNLQEYSGVKYYVFKEDIDRITFDASKLNTTLIEREVLRFVNHEREKAGLKPYKWNDWVRAVAYNHSKDMGERNYFAHTSPEGKDHYDRLKESGMFFIVSGEVLSYQTGLGPKDNETSIARAAVEGWLESPGHRSIILDIDNLFSDAGVGAYCEENTCFITMNVVGLEEEHNITLNVKYASFFYLNDPGLGFDITVPVSVKVESSKPIDVYIVPDKEQFDRFLKSQSFKKIYYKESTKTFEKTLNASVGTGLFVYSRTYDGVEINIKIKYYP